MSFPAYPDYKESGVEWLGLIPKEWTVIAPKRVIRHESGGTEIKGNCALEPSDGLYPAFSASGQDVWLPSYRYDLSGLVLSAVGARCGKTFKADGRWGVVANTQCLIPSSDASRDYFWYLTNIENWWEIGGSAQPFVLTSATLDRLFALPPLAEQTQIARFLDHETARIDALIEEQQRLIELLKEKRQAVISHAVTKGLDPTVPMKDSGVEWLGEVPAHWEVLRIGAVYSETADKGLAELPVLRVSIHYGVSDKELSEEESDRKITRIDDREKYKRVCPGDLVYNMMRAWQGGFGAVLVDGLVSPAYVVARPKIGDISRYVEQLLRTSCAVEEMRKNSYGITDFRLRLYWDQFKNISIVIPPEVERQRIMERIDSLICESEALKNEADQLINILQERRSALISAAVTGKIDVRDWQPTASTQAPELEVAEAD